MLFRRSRSGVVIEVNPFRVLLARLGRLGGGAVHIEQVAELGADDPEGVRRELRALFPEHKTYVPGICGVFPPTRLLQREELNARKFADPDYLPNLLASQYKISAEKWRVGLVNPFDGTPYGPKNPPLKDALLCGESSEELLAAQHQLLDLGVLPRRMEIASLAVLGGLQNYQALMRDGQPVAVVEFDLRRTYLFILGKNGVHTSAPIPFGFDALVETACKELGSDDEPAVRARLTTGEAAVVVRSPRLLRQLVRNLKPAVDYFELHTGQRVNDLYCTFLPPGLAWLGQTLAVSLEMQELPVAYPAWLEALGISSAADLPARLGPHWLSLFSLVARLNPVPHAKKTE